jgi:DNA-binding transcriptional regulator GbsR (MarR family)
MTDAMNEDLWRFVDATATWAAESYGTPRMTGRVLAWLLVCDPPEQTAAQLAEALEASRGSISGATTTLVRMGLVERLHVRGERADRFRLRPGAWDDTVRDPSLGEARRMVALGLDALAGASKSRRARLEELDALYAWYEERMDAMYEEWLEYKRTKLGGGRDA